MRHPPRRPVNKSVISAAALCLAVALPGCSAASSSTGSAGPAATPTGSAAPSPSHSTVAPSAFTVTGSHPVPPNGSQDTNAQTPDASCDSATHTADHALGVRVARGFALANLQVSAALLRHFLEGSGTKVSYGAGSAISKQARASATFAAVDNQVQTAILSQLKAGQTHVRLSAAQLPTVAFTSTTSDLYWGFRGTQGLTVTGSGHRLGGRFTGTLSFVIADSYGFPAGDTLDGFGPPMRYLQTACGAPRHIGGAHWFPDTITVTVMMSGTAAT
jgi:hypothetical protein